MLIQGNEQYNSLIISDSDSVRWYIDEIQGANTQS